MSKSTTKSDGRERVDSVYQTTPIMSATSTVIGKMARPVGEKSIRELLIDNSSKIRQAIGG
jgi:hypothetical protein